MWCNLFDACWSNSFSGEIESLFPELTRNPMEQSFDDEKLAIIPCDREPELFEAAYANKESFWRNSRRKLANAGIEMPENFDWWRYIVKVSGTDFS
ncbi:unnamed protein product [Lawsonibacter asaccharolyticus]|nr:unnamed protein product [Lawsonibacter asaccharolyticus]